MLRTFSTILGLLLLAGWFLLLRPTALGGPAEYVVVSGSSMEPTLMPGDLVITQEQETYQRGDIAVYQIPDGQPGSGSDAAIVHRLVGGDGAEGFTAQGDNREAADPWTPKHEDIVGAVWQTIPGGGAWLVRLLEPGVLGGVAGGLTTYWILAGGRREPRRPDTAGVGPAASAAAT